MRVLFVHNHYQLAGGEDVVMRAESELLVRMGHAVERWEANNDSIVSRGDALKTALECAYSLSAEHEMRQRIDRFKPDLVHIHNFFPRLSPSIHYACHRAQIPVVQTLHNYRLLCPSATFRREGRVCEDCLGKFIPWPAVRHACYRGSRSASAAVVNMLSIHRACGTWSRCVSRFIALTNFARAKFIEGGLPAGKIVVKPNFVEPDPGIGSGKGDFALFVGRLSEEKGIDTLISAWSRFSLPLRLKIIGDGPLASTVAAAVSIVDRIEWMGERGRQEISRAMAEAKILILPSTWYEGGLPSVALEAFAAGLPIIASRLGSMAELVVDGVTGILFTPGAADELAAAVEGTLSHPQQLEAMRESARREFLTKYTAEFHYAALVEIYNSALGAEPGRI